MPNSYPSTKVALGPTAWTPAPAGRVPATNCPQPASCPACGGLDCLCRPRFFAGQLLTEDDLNRLESYVVNKNKLHNRYLHGWGVVCGLEVVCDPCGAGVVVRSGYALAPCGEDIVVCADQSVDVCALITACQPPGVDPCPPAVALGTSTPTYSSYVGLSLGQPASDPCSDAVDRWVLAICYDEQTSRGVMPLRPTSSSCGCGATSSSTSTGVCGCAGKTKKGGCGSGTKASSNGTSKSCGCAGSGTKTATTARSASTVACEPTLICEGFRFIAYKQAPLEGVRVGPSSSLASLGSATTADAGPLIERVLCCWESLLSRLGRVPTTGDRVMRTQWSTDMRAALLDFVSSYPTYDCGLAAELRAVPTPDPQQDNFDAALLETSVSLATIAAEYLRYCLCQALLPPCPDPVDGDCVPLALIEVRRSDCRIVDICNWGARRIALTFPQLQYWASPLQLGDRLISAHARRQVPGGCGPRGAADRRGRASRRASTRPPAAASSACAARASSAGAGRRRNERDADRGAARASVIQEPGPHDGRRHGSARRYGLRRRRRSAAADALRAGEPRVAAPGESADAASGLVQRPAVERRQ